MARTPPTPQQYHRSSPVTGVFSRLLDFGRHGPIKARMKLLEPHRLARLHYGPRVASFALSFVASLMLMGDGLVSWAFLPIAVVLFLVYPQLVMLHACLSDGGRRLANRCLVLDALLLGAWLPVIGFNFGLGFAMVAAVMLNNSISGGWRWLLASVAALAAGALPVGWLTGFRFEPFGSLAVTVLGLGGILAYMNVVTELFHQQAVHLLAVMRENAAKRKLFEALAAVGLMTPSTASIEAIVDAVLDQLACVLPPERGIGIVVRDRVRIRLQHCAAFRGVPAAQQPALLAEAERRRRDGGGTPSEPAPVADGESCWLFAGGSASTLEALFVVRGGPLDYIEQRAVELFLQQLAGMLDNHALTAQLRALASTDGLTGLANRSRFDECLAAAIARKRRNPDSDFSLVVADINGLKLLNDSRGHEAGDQLIVAAASILRATCRETDLVARLGGDEFVLLCPATQVHEAARLIERLRQRMMAAPATPATPAVSMSLGAADSSETDPAEVMALADQRMYADKEAFYLRRDEPESPPAWSGRPPRPRP